MSAPTKVKLDEAARSVILQGVKAIFEPVRRTLGPEGRNALLYRTYNRGPRITNDGVTVAEVVEPKDEFVKIAADAFKEAAKRTNEKAGDGTTTTIVIAGNLAIKCFGILKEVTAAIRNQGATKPRHGVMALRKEILESAKEVKAKIKAVAKPVESLEELEKIATISVEDEDLGKKIAKVSWDLGPDGFVDVLEGFKGEIETETQQGMRFPARTAAKAFINNPARYEMVAEQSKVLVTNHVIDNAGKINAFTSKMKDSKLIVIAPSFSETVLVGFLAAAKQGFFIYPVAAPALTTEQFEDICAFTGAVFIDKAKDQQVFEVQPSRDLGYLERLIVRDPDAKDDAVALGGQGASLMPLRVETLKGQMKEQKLDIHKKMFERRIAALSGGIGVFRVGAASQAESLYLKLKVEDAVYACRAALRGGYVKGGGVCLKEIAEKMTDDNILKEALLSPYNQIQENADGFLEIGENVIDPADAVYYAVEHATSVVAHLVTVGIVIPEEKEMGPDEGYREIARALDKLGNFYGVQMGLIKASELEAEKDRDSMARDILAADRD